jgi:hypothetical protein
MATYGVPARSRTLGMISVALGVLGLALFWWVPFGMVIALTGLLFGAVGWVRSTHTGITPAWAIVGTLFGLAVVALDIAIAAGGLEAVQMTAFR